MKRALRQEQSGRQKDDEYRGRGPMMFARKSLTLPKMLDTFLKHESYI
jgi:hypothetical protein